MKCSASRIGIAVVRLSLLCGALSLAASEAHACSATDPSWANRDDDGDGICNGVDDCPYEPDPAQTKAANGIGVACQMQAITVPWVPTNPTIPHVTYSGRQITLKGIARYGGNQYNWDYGDAPATTGTASVGSTGWINIGDAHLLGTPHTYGTVGETDNVNRLFVATLSVKNTATGAIATAVYPVQVLATGPYAGNTTTAQGCSVYPAGSASCNLDPSLMDVRVAVAIDEGLWNLHVTQSRSQYADGSPGYNQLYGQWGDLAGSCAALDALQLHGSKPLQPYDTDPYVEDTQRALNYLLAQPGTQSLAFTTWAAKADGSPDVSGDGHGILFSYNNTYIYGFNYADGICAVGFASSGSPGRVSTTGVTGVFNKTYAAIAQDVVDWFAFDQNDSSAGTTSYQGGWYYTLNQGGADGSTNQWPILGISALKNNMGSTIPAFVTNQMPIFLNYIHNTTVGPYYGGYGYTAASTWPNVAKTSGAIIANFFLGKGNSNPDIEAGYGLIYNRWTAPTNSWTDYNLGDSYAMYDAMKAMQSASPKLARVPEFTGGTAGNTATGHQTGNSFDWYYTPPGQTQVGLATNIVTRQAADGSVTDNQPAPSSKSVTLDTAWDVLILMKAVANVPPKAMICDCTAQWPKNSPITLDGSCSVEPDQSRTIINPQGYKWDFTYDGSNFIQSLDSNNLGVQGPVVTYPQGFPNYTEDVNGVPNGQTYPVALQVTDNTPISLGGPQSSITTCNVIIKPPPHCPLAVIGGPYIGFINTAVQFNANGSSQVDGDPLTYDWDFHNLNHLTDATADSTLINPTFRWTANGTYPIELAVTNHPPGYPDENCTVVAYTTVVIGPHAPVASAGGPYTGLAKGDTVALSGAGSYDPDNNSSGLTYSWDLTGAGNYADSHLENPNFIIPPNTVVGTSFNVCLRVSVVSDVTKLTMTSTPSCATVTAIDHYSPPTCVVAPTEVQSCTGGIVQVVADGSHSTDPLGDHFSFAWSSTDCPGLDPTSATTSMARFTIQTEEGGQFWSANPTPSCQPSCTAKLIVTNSRNLSNTCYEVIQINDLQTPTFSALPQNTTIECDANATAHVNAWLASAGGTDPCTPPATPVTLANDFLATAGACGGVGTAGSVNGSIKVTWTAIDPCNTNTSQASATVTVADTRPPVLSLPAPITVEATSASGAVVGYTATAFDAATGSTPIHCSPPSGSTFPLGLTTVTCNSTDTTNHTATGTFTITVNDHTAPVLSLSSNKSVEATNANGAAVTYTATANDAVDGATAVSCLPASGSVFTIGTTPVNCSSTDVHLNKSIGSFTVTVQDSSPPTITVPSAVTSEATGPDGAIVSFTASAHDTVSGNTPVNCSPASGSIFPLGPTTVTCTSTDGKNPSSATFTVTVQDKTPPAFSGMTQGGDLTLEATGASGASSSDYGITATDLVDGASQVTCVPAPQTFPLGQTPVSCSSSDNHGNTGSLAFTVNVVDTTPPEVSCPRPITIAANGPIAAVNWNVAEPSSTAIASFLAGASDSDLVDPLPSLVNDAPWMFPVGETTQVTFTATDAHMNPASCTSFVTVTNEQDFAPALTCPPSAVITSGAGAEIDWNAVFHHPVAVQLLIVSGAGSSRPFSLADMGDQSYQLSSSATASGAYAVRIRAVDQITGSAVDCNRFLAVTPPPAVTRATN